MPFLHQGDVGERSPFILCQLDTQVGDASSDV